MTVPRQIADKLLDFEEYTHLFKSARQNVASRGVERNGSRFQQRRQKEDSTATQTFMEGDSDGGNHRNRQVTAVEDLYTPSDVQEPEDTEVMMIDTTTKSPRKKTTNKKAQGVRQSRANVRNQDDEENKEDSSLMQQISDLMEEPLREHFQQHFVVEMDSNQQPTVRTRLPTTWNIPLTGNVISLLRTNRLPTYLSPL